MNGAIAEEVSMSKLIQPLSGCLLAAALVAGACSDSSDYVYVDPAEVQEVGDELWSITLTARAAERTGLETVEVATQPIDGAERLVVPYSAVMYHYDGTTWSYAVHADLTYVREQIVIDYIEGDTAVLVEGPEVGTEVVSVGAAELYGVEFGIGK